MLVALLIAAALADDTEDPVDGGDYASPPADFVAWFNGFQAAVAHRDAEAVAAMTRFPFRSSDLVGRVPASLADEDGVVVLDHDAFVANYRKLFDKEARGHVANGAYVFRTDLEIFSLEIWSDKTSYTWLDFVRDDDGHWKVGRTDNVGL